MDGSYLIIVYLLLGLAVLDLMVGVSNDAVNFLNSAFGSKVATRRTILIIASAGILVGALFSSGLMEVARKGIFHPEMFSYSDIMVLFLAVMLADVLLLDLFNTFGMPTSTTVSIVFELLGAAVAVAAVSVVAQGGNLEDVNTYINGGNAVVIIGGILVSVAVAFVVGALVQFLSRLVFTFQGGRESGLTSLIWSSLAITVMFFFIIMKGLKGTTFLDKETVAQITGNPWMPAFTVFGLCLVVGGVLQYQFRINLLKIVVLAGTFSLALAFASNDLVNFIGVPLAGLTAHESWSASNLSADEFKMAALAGKVQGQSGWLVIAGIIMVMTLWLSEKARTVTETEINLSRQDEGSERFQPHTLSRLIVRGFLMLAKLFGWLFPRRTTMWVEQRYARPSSSPKSDPNGPAFDLVRASINLTVASILIALATTLKLPLSTTYVTFMVAMGTSLADRSWGRDSAVYRVAGVINVIGGWFATAALAFTVAAVYALVLKFLGLFGVVLLMAVAAAALFHTHRLHSRRQQSKLKVDRVDLWNLKSTLEQVQSVISSSITGLINDDRANFAETKQRTKQLWNHLQQVEVQLVSHLHQSKRENFKETRGRLDLFTLEQDLYQSAHLISKSCKDYVRNAHTPLFDSQRERLNDLVAQFAKLVESSLQNRQGHYDPVLAQAWKEALELALSEQMEGLRADRYSQRNTRLLLSLYLELQDVLYSMETMQEISVELLKAGVNLASRPQPVASALTANPAQPSVSKESAETAAETSQNAQEGSGELATPPPGKNNQGPSGASA